MNTDNKTMFGISSETERGIWVTWSVIVFLSSSFGDTLILIGTLKYSAIKHHKIIVAVMQHLAVCDILLTMFKVLPSTLSLTADHWTLGEAFCPIHEHVGVVCNGVTMLLTVTLTTVKYLTVRYPLRAEAWPTRLGHKVCAAIWILTVFLFAPKLVINVLKRDTLYFTYKYYTCTYDISSYPNWYAWYGRMLGAVYTMIPYPAVKVTSILLLVAARRTAARQGERVQLRGVLTVLLTVGVLLISFLPVTVVNVLEHGLKVMQSGKTWRVVGFIQYLNIMANFFVYSLTIRSFRKFLKLKLLSLLSFLGPTSERQRPLQLQRTFNQQAALGRGRPAQQRQQGEDPLQRKELPQDEELPQQQELLTEEQEQVHHSQIQDVTSV